MIEILNNSPAPAAVGTYSQGAKVDGWYFFSGQIGLDPQSMELAQGFSAQLDRILKNIDLLLESHQLKRSDILKTTIFLTDLNDFSQVNEAYQEFFQAPYPARSTVEVSALPKGALVEIEVIAYQK